MADTLTSPWHPQPPGDPVAYATMARSPVTGAIDFPVRVLAGEVEHLAKYGPFARLRLLQQLVPPTLAFPNHIFAYKSDHHAGWCYLAKLKSGVRVDGTANPPPSGKTFAAFFHEGENVLSDWGWEVEDPENPALPLQNRGRKAECVWSKG